MTPNGSLHSCLKGAAARHNSHNCFFDRLNPFKASLIIFIFIHQIWFLLPLVDTKNKTQYPVLMLLKLSAVEQVFSYEFNDIWYAILYMKNTRQFGKYCNFSRGAFSQCNLVHLCFLPFTQKFIITWCHNSIDLDACKR